MQVDAEYVPERSFYVIVEGRLEVTVQQAEDLRKRAEASKAAGTTEILYTPAGDDLLGQAETFYEAVQSVQG